MVECEFGANFYNQRQYMQQSAAIKKKKKYVMVQRPNNPLPPSSASSSHHHTSSPTATLSRSRFDYTFDQMLNHIFAKLLPDSRFTIRLSQRLIFGRERQLDRFLQSLDENVRFYTCFLLQLQDDTEKEDIEYELEEHYRAKLFGERLVQKCIYEFFLGTCYELQCTAFLKMFERDRNPRLFIRMSLSHVEEFLQKISSKAKPVKSQSVSDRVAPRGNRRECRVEASSITIQSQHFDAKNWKEFLHKSEKLDKRDIEIIQNKNPYGYVETYKVRLLCQQEGPEEDTSRKIQAFDYYFRHQNFIPMPLKDSKRKQELISQYGGIKKSWLEVRVVKGYRSPKWDDKTLLYKLRCGQVPGRRSNFASEPIQAFQLIGLLPKVREYLGLLEKDINTVPMDDLKLEIYLEPEGDLRDALKGNKKAEEYLQNFIQQYLSRFGDVYTLKGVKFLVRGIRLDLVIPCGKQEQFTRGVKVQLQSGMLREVGVHRFQLDIPVDQEIKTRLQSEGVLIVRNEGKSVFFLSSNAELPSNLTIVQNVQLDFQSLSQEVVECLGRARLVHYQSIIQSLREGADNYKQIFVSDPTSTDKMNFSICLIGPRKKNSLFNKEIKKRIDDFQATLGTYSEEISGEMADFMAEDSTIQELLKQWRISLLVDPMAKTEAVLQVEPMAIGKKITIIQGNSLSRVPFGSSLYFLGKKQLQQFHENFLSSLKMKCKKAHPSQFIKDTDPHRKIDLFYKEASNPIELLSKALDQEKLDNFCFIFPQGEKQRFLRELLTVLTSHFAYERKKYNITIIDPDPTSDIRSIVGLPDHSSLVGQKQAILQWFCQNRPYSQSGNEKINEALANGSQRCLLEKADLTQLGTARRYRTHQCNLTTKTIRCIRTKKETPLVEAIGGKGFIYQGGFIPLGPQNENLLRYHLRAKSQSTFFLSLVYYSIDLSSMTQRNIFTGNQRKIEKKERQVGVKVEQYGGKIRANYDVTIPQLIFNFQAEDGRNLDKAILQVSHYLQSKKIRQNISLKPLGSVYRKQLQELISAKAAESTIAYSYDALLHQVKVESLQQAEVDRFRSVIEREVEYLLSLQRMATNSAMQKEFTITFPVIWQAQTHQIQKFVVAPNTPEFASVQAQFSFRPILLLERIQNKFLYKKYQEEFQHLTFLNGGQRPKQLQLFHGTGSTDPELIWGDREGGFNINYSSETNLLGMGVYFAQKAEYSNSYRHKGGPKGNCMFLCSVIVGESQQMAMTRSKAGVRDTGMKGNGLRYESMLGKHDICDIYVVYKDKRAYPHYLIHYQV